MFACTCAPFHKVLDCRPFWCHPVKRIAGLSCNACSDMLRYAEMASDDGQSTMHATAPIDDDVDDVN